MRHLRLYVCMFTLLCFRFTSAIHAEIVPFTGTDEIFSDLVRAKNYRSALNYACEKFSLSCGDLSLDQNSNDEYRAITHPYSNQIVLYTNAFRFLGQPHPGWLAALIAHERVHTRQPFALRTIVQNATSRFLGDHTIEASLEYEAWEAMLKYQRRFALDCEMIVEIDQQMQYYISIINRHGALPKDATEEADHYYPSYQHTQSVKNLCKRQQENFSISENGP